MDVGSVCIKTKGRNAGRRVVILSEAKAGKVFVDGAKSKKKQCNVLHLFPLGMKVKIGKTATHDEVVKALKEMD
jgi:large subunit ribosomal protein L14e